MKSNYVLVELEGGYDGENPEAIKSEVVRRLENMPGYISARTVYDIPAGASSRSYGIPGDAEKYLRKYVRAKTAQGEVSFTGVVICHTSAPTVGINCPDGSQGNWRADLCEVVDLPDDVINILLAQHDSKKDTFGVG